jgi:hypothetical protein
MTSPPSEPAASPEGAREASELPALGDDGDRISVTDVNGTVARFEMAYSPADSDRFRFGPPVRQWIPSILFLCTAIAMVATVVIGQGSSTSPLSHYLAEQDRGRPIGSFGLSIIVLLCALGTVVRAQMRGIVVRGDGVEARYLLPLGVPKIRRWTSRSCSSYGTASTSACLRCATTRDFASCSSASPAREKFA